MVDEAETGGGIGEEEGQLIRAAIEFNDRDAADILTPRVNVVAVEETDPPEEIAAVFRDNPYSRLPVYRDTIDTVVGMIHEKDIHRLLCEGGPLATVIKEVAYVPPTLPISALLRRLQRTKTHMAVVVDEFGGTQGIVTMEDILEELVGEIFDEHDPVSEKFHFLEDGSLLAACDAGLEDLFEAFGMRIDYDAVTVGGWVMRELGSVPRVGESFAFGPLHVQVTRAAPRRPLEVRVARIRPASDT